MADELYYLQDTRVVCGNCAMFWRRGNHGYTCNLDEAKVGTLAEIQTDRPTDVPVRKADVDAKAKRHIDVHELPRREETDGK